MQKVLNTTRNLEDGSLSITWDRKVFLLKNK